MWGRGGEGGGLGGVRVNMAQGHDFFLSFKRRLHLCDDRKDSTGISLMTGRLALTHPGTPEIPTPISISRRVSLKPELRGCVKVEVAVLGSASLIAFMVSVDVQQHRTELNVEVRGLRTCAKVEVAVLGSPSLIVFTVPVDVTQH